MAITQPVKPAFYGALNNRVSLSQKAVICDAGQKDAKILNAFLSRVFVPYTLRAKFVFLRYTHRHRRHRRVADCRPPRTVPLSSPAFSRSRRRSRSCAAALQMKTETRRSYIYPLPGIFMSARELTGLGSVATRRDASRRRARDSRDNGAGWLVPGTPRRSSTAASRKVR